MKDHAVQVVPGFPDGAGEVALPEILKNSRDRSSSSLSTKRDQSMQKGRAPNYSAEQRQGGSSQAARDEDPLSWFPALATRFHTLWLAWTYSFASFGKGAWGHYSCRVARSAAPYISLGKGVGLARDVRLDVCANPSTDAPILIMEDGSGLQRRGVISARNGVHVMRNVMFGFAVLVMDHAGDAAVGADSVRRNKPTGGTIRIEEDCWIGSGAVIVCEEGELVIGRHSVVGAHSVVRRSIPAYSVVTGDPARIVKHYDFSKGNWVLGCARPEDAMNHSNPEPAASTLR
jgi:acetyltransferase-like isoleucine patch superfamily enzyme